MTWQDDEIDHKRCITLNWIQTFQLNLKTPTWNSSMGDFDFKNTESELRGNVEVINLG